MANKETVGDMIVRHRYEALDNPRTSKAERAEILRKPAPRSMVNQVWPPAK